MVDAWTWLARYEDGSTVTEMDDHGFADVDPKRVRAFEIYPLDNSSTLPSFSLLVDPDKGERVFFTRTRALGWLQAGGEPETLHTVLGLHCDDHTVYIHFDAQRRVVIASERVL